MASAQGFAQALGVDIISSGRISNGLIDDDSAITPTREGIPQLYFPGKGRAAFVPWVQIRRIEIHLDRADFILWNGMVGQISHKTNGYNTETLEELLWYIKLEGLLILWSLQSEPKCQMPDGGIVYELGVPKMVWMCRKPTERRDLLADPRVSNVEVKSTIVYHEDYWGYVYYLQQLQEQQALTGNTTQTKLIS